jgi:transaldolase
LKNPLLALQDEGQSVWYDNIERRLLASGELTRMIREDGLRGVTSNPTIFEKAIGGSRDYDEELAELIGRGLSTQAIYERLAIEDIRLATDLFRPIYDETGGQDGFVSLEVSPLLAARTQETVSEAKRLFRSVDRPNVMIKVPATPEGIPAVEQLIREGLNINITLMFSLAHYEAVAEAYLRGLEARARAGKPLDAVSSVASFFVSRVDTYVNRQLEALDVGVQHAEPLRGKIAIANSKIVYQRFREIFTGSRFRKLAEKGARAQRVLWASTSTKNPAYRDVLYVEELIGPDTVNTMPPVTLAAFRDHGKIRGATVLEDVEEAKQTLETLTQVGIDLRQVTEEIQRDGVKAFADSYNQLLAAIAKKHQSVGLKA